MTKSQQKEGLTNFLKMVTKNENLFIYNSDGRCGNTFAIAENTENGGISTKSNFMTYKEMNCYFFGVLATQDKRIKF